MTTDLQKRLAHVDLNLLPILLILIQTRSTRETADRIGRTQSAVSHALNRLRETLGDQLLVRHGPKLLPTPLFLELEEPLTRVLFDAANVVERGVHFDPATSTRQVVIGCMDLAMPLAERLCRQLAQEGPGLTFRITGPRHGDSRLLSGEVDLVLSLYRNKAERGLEMTHAASVEWAFYADPGLGLPDRPDMDTWISHPHVQVFTGGGGRTPVDDAARIAGVSRTIALQVDNFMQALFVASQGQMLFTTFPRLAAPVAEKLGLRCHALPFDMAVAPFSVFTRQTRHDPFSRWLHRSAVSLARTALSP